ncbi:MAG: N-acetyl-gamma-glutamyl-phosphate reductase [Spirochaetia bacterium]|nr:N-acetyl-gamma-glutamyl-phosphate reductase [Spirochaetia bacterium]
MSDSLHPGSPGGLAPKRTGVAIIGAGGFTGRELLQILAGHPALEAAHITSNAHAGRSIADVFPDLPHQPDLVFKKHEDAIPDGMPVFLAVPNDSSLTLVPKLSAAGHPVVDLSGSFRLHDKSLFEKYYKLEHTAFDLMQKITFGIPEMFRDGVKSARIVSNPGCFATGAILPLYFLGDLRSRLRGVSIDAKSGVSGAGGRTEDAGFSYNSVYENFRAYKIQSHQHQPEIEEYSWHGLGAAPCPLVFTPHLLPVFRGILSTITLFWDGPAPESLLDRFKEISAKETFIRFLEKPEDVELKRVQNTNYVDMGLRSVSSTTVIVSGLDNLVKGAAGQAVQNMNLMLGLPETSGLV